MECNNRWSAIGWIGSCQEINIGDYKKSYISFRWHRGYCTKYCWGTIWNI
nr:MAG TPA_asm: hypothetical protein [Bacteriophage sp.]